MRTHRFVSHTADVRLEITGDSLPELFHAGLEGMTELMAPEACGSKVRSGKGPERVGEAMEIRLEAPDITALLVDFLSEALTLANEQQLAFCRVDFPQLELKPAQLTATLHGMAVREFSEDIKAVTYHEANVVRSAEGQYRTTIVFDM
jgi:SHS2 domain-containing protein